MNTSIKDKEAFNEAIDEDKDMEVPTEDSSNHISCFSTNDNKLVSDKGSVKNCDLDAFHLEKLHKPKNSVKLPYVKSNTWKFYKEEVKRPQRQSSYCVRVPMRKRNTANND